MSPIVHIASFHCAAEFGRYRGIANINQTAPSSIYEYARSQLICPTGGRTIFLSSPSRKNISLNPSGKSELGVVPSCPIQRGVSRTSRTSGRDAVDAAARETGDANADGEVAWS
jgi:hypothetical protein